MIAIAAELQGRCPSCGRWISLYQATDDRYGRTGTVRAHGYRSARLIRPKGWCLGTGRYPIHVEPIRREE